MDVCCPGEISPENKAVETELEATSTIKRTAEDINDKDLVNSDLQYQNSPPQCWCGSGTPPTTSSSFYDDFVYPTFSS